ncbi:MAG: xanthan lyase [Bacteroidales bacterium]
MKLISQIILAITILPLSSLAQSSSNWRSEVNKILEQEMRAIPQSGSAKVISHRVEKGKSIKIVVSPTITSIPLHSSKIEDLYSRVSKVLPQDMRNYDLSIIADGKELSYYTPNAFRVSGKWDPSRSPKIDNTPPLVKYLTKPYGNSITAGLEGKHIALWQSHGRYYEQSLQRWEWQRSKCFQTVEDLFTQSYVLPYLVPMLRNAGAVTLLPREMDSNPNEIIVDRDGSTGASLYSEEQKSGTWHQGGMAGFANPKSSYQDGENPFSMGSYREIKSTKQDNPSLAHWTPDIPERGKYAVYVSYKSLTNSATDAQYIIRHLGGLSKVQVNQQIGGSTWVYLGHYSFEKGVNFENGSLSLSNRSENKGAILTADAVKFGGGMGNIARSPKESTLKFPVEPETSSMPRFVEASRYWMQWAGFPRSVYSMKDGDTDYIDDYAGRGLWVNYLAGGSSRIPKEKGMKIPIDLALAFHSDAGVTYNDTTIGTLGIYYTKHNGGKYADGTSRISSRDLTDIVVTSIVSDIRAQFDPNWTRRAIWDRSYAESRTPEVPTILLELLSHQNLADMRYGHDPQFKFVVSRAIYKGMLKFIASRDQRAYCVQPLPINKFAIDFYQINNARLTWVEQVDTLEPTAKPEQYIVYTRVDDGEFDNGIIVNGAEYIRPIEEGKRYSFKVTALNRGGESFPSEVLTIHKASNERGKVLIVNGFNRVSAPGSFATKDSIAGFTDIVDFGVPDHYSIDYIGKQHEFRRSEQWTDDDSPGFGASYDDWAGRLVAGNQFDYPSIHGKSFATLGYSYTSVSDEAFVDIDLTKGEYSLIDLILGKEKKTTIGHGAYEPNFSIFGSGMQSAIRTATNSGVNIIVSGAYIGTDISDRSLNPVKDLEREQFAKDVLKYIWRTDKASSRGEVRVVPSPSFALRSSNIFSYHSEPNNDSYHVDQPDGIEPASKEAFTFLRYRDTNISAAVAFKGDKYRSIAIGFPIEAIKSQIERDTLFDSLIRFFLEPQN